VVGVLACPLASAEPQDASAAVLRRHHRHGRYPLAPTLRAASFEADRAARVLPDPGLVVVPIVAVHGARIPWGRVVVDGVPVVTARHLPSMLRQLPAVLGPERVAAMADQARLRFRAAA
jgi:hypothetical protein